MQKKNGKKSKWIKWRHNAFIRFIYPFVYLAIKIRYKIKMDRFRPGRKGQYLILYNHQTPWDQMFISMVFGKAIYYVATEDIFSAGFASNLLRHFFAPIPIKKAVSDVRAVVNCVKVAKEGGTIAIAPEGNRTYSGRTGNMKSSIAGMARALKMPIAFLRIEGGYGAEPRWSDVVRKGKMHVYVKDVLEYDTYKDYSDEELFKIIKEQLFVDENCLSDTFESKKSAEYLERLIYVCPDCKISEFESNGRFLTCKTCGKRIEHLKTKELKCTEGELPFRFVGEWYDYQEKFIHSLDLSQYAEKALFRDDVRWSEVIVYKNKKLLSGKAELSAFGDRFVVNCESETSVLAFDGIRAATICGRNKLQIYFGDKIFQFKGDKRFNAVKYMHIYYHAKNREEENNDEFLGL